MSDEVPVTVAVRRPDGSVEQVQIGTAVKSGAGFSIRFGELTIGGTPSAQPSYSTPRRSAGAASAPSGMVFPPYGRSKGMPIDGATMQDLEFYANGARRTLGDPSKARFHDKERQLLAAIEAEMARQGGGGGGGGRDDRDERPPSRDDDYY